MARTSVISVTEYLWRQLPTRTLPSLPAITRLCVKDRAPALGENRFHDAVDFGCTLGRIDEQREQVTHVMLGLRLKKPVEQKAEILGQAPAVWCWVLHDAPGGRRRGDEPLAAFEVAVQGGLGHT